MYIDIYTHEADKYMLSCIDTLDYMYKHTYTMMDTYFFKCYHNPVYIGKTLLLQEQ